MDFTPTARTVARLIAEQPTDADMEIARRVAHWIADVAQCLPGDFSTEGDPDGEAAIERLRQSANDLTGQTYLVEALQTLLQTLPQ